MQEYLTYDKKYDLSLALMPKTNSRLHKNMNLHIKQQIESLTAAERTDLVLESIPELNICMENHRKNSLKYNMFMNRINGKEVDQLLLVKLMIADSNKLNMQHTQI